VRLVHVARGLPQQARVVLVETQPGIAVVAKETTDVAVLMVVVDAELKIVGALNVHDLLRAGVV